LFVGVLEAFLGSATWKFSVVSRSDAEIYQFSRVSFLDKFPLLYMATLGDIGLATFFSMQKQFESALRCSQILGWTPSTVHDLIDCQVSFRECSSSAVVELNHMLKKSVAQHSKRRQNRQ
jgi:hypothetical protein